MLNAFLNTVRHFFVRRAQILYADGATIIDEPYFQLSLPGKWQDKSTKDSYDLRSEDEHQQITIAISLARRPITGPELLKTTLAFYDARLNAIRTLSGDTCQFGEKWIEEPPGGLNIHRTGLVKAQRIQISINLYARTDKTIAVTYHYYFDDSPMDNFENHSRQILSLFALK